MSDVRLAEAVAALSLAIDIGMGQPLEQGLRTSLIAATLARKTGIGDDDVSRVLYLSLIRHVGCTAESDMVASFLGDEIAFRGGAITLDFTKPREVMPYAVRHVGAGKSGLARARQVGKMFAGSRKFMSSATAVCETGAMLANRLGFDEVVQQGLWQVFERWDGKGIPGKVGGEDILVPARYVPVAEAFEAFSRLHGRQRAIEVVTSRRGTAYAPEVVDAVLDGPDDLLAPLEEPSVWDAVLDAEPRPQRDLTDERLDDVLEAMADFTDLKSTFTYGHSRGVADLAAEAARAAGMTAADVTALRRAGLVHDVGRVGVSTSVWSKSGALTRDEWEKVRLHPYYTERVLTRPAAFARLGELASTHHERLDGGGYHRAVPGTVLSTGARILAAADGYRARIEARPHRAALTPEDAADSLRAEAKGGRLDGDAVEAVLRAAGHEAADRPRKRAVPGGLTERELDVLQLVALGESIKQIAATLTIAPKTADAHIQHIYTKLGVSTRAGATLFAVENNLVDRARR